MRRKKKYSVSSQCTDLKVGYLDYLYDRFPKAHFSFEIIKLGRDGP